MNKGGMLSNFSLMISKANSVLLDQGLAEIMQEGEG